MLFRSVVRVGVELRLALTADGMSKKAGRGPKPGGGKRCDEAGDGAQHEGRAQDEEDVAGTDGAAFVFAPNRGG